MTSLLPPSATAAERAIEASAGPADPGVAVLRALMAPESIPAGVLAWLAWGEDVPAWPDADGARRDVTARSHRLHGRIGTKAGLASGARIAGGELTALVGPPAKTYLGWWDESSRRGWLSSMPQLRVYPRRTRSFGAGLCLADGCPGEFPAKIDTVTRATSRATVWQDGQEAELTVIEWRAGAGNATIDLGRKATGPGLHCGEPLDGQVAVYTAADRVWRLSQYDYRYNAPTMLVRTLAPGFSALSADVEVVAERAPRLGMCCLDGAAFADDCHPCRGDAETRLYRRSYLHDTAVAAEAKKGPSYLGTARLGMEPFRIEARIRAPKSTSTSAHARDAAASIFPCARRPGDRIRPCLDAMAWFRAAADKVTVDIRNRETARASQTYAAGSIVAGQINERL